MESKCLQFSLYIEYITRKNSTGRDGEGEGKLVISQKVNSLACIICKFLHLGEEGFVAMLYFNYT